MKPCSAHTRRDSAEWIEYLIREQVAFIALLHRQGFKTGHAYRHLHSLRSRLA